MSAPRFPVAEGAAHVEQDMLSTGRVPYDLAPEGYWHSELKAADFRGGTQTLTATIPSAGLVDGVVRLRLAGTDAAGDAVDVTAEAAFDTDEDGTAAALEAEIESLRATTLATVVSTESVAANVVTVVLLTGTDITATLTYIPAQTADAVWSGTLQDAVAYMISIDDVVTQVVRAGGSPADVAAMAVAMEAALEANTDLTGVLISADDDATDTNALVFEPGIDTATLAASYSGRVQTWTNTVGGTATDGDYVLSFTHSSLPDLDGDNQINVTVTADASGGDTNSDIAVAFEAAIEANPHLASLIASADDSTNTNAIVAASGVTGLVVAVVEAPAPGTLAISETTPTITLTDTTPAGPEVTLTSRFTVAFADIDSGNVVPPRMAHFGGYIDVKTAFGSGTIYVDDGGGTIATDYITSADATSATVQDSASSSEAPYGVMPTNTMRAHLVGATAPPTAGRAIVNITLAPLPEDLTS